MRPLKETSEGDWLNKLLRTAKAQFFVENQRWLVGRAMANAEYGELVACPNYHCMISAEDTHLVGNLLRSTELISGQVGNNLFGCLRRGCGKCPMFPSEVFFNPKPNPIANERRKRKRVKRKTRENPNLVGFYIKSRGKMDCSVEACQIIFGLVECFVFASFIT